MGPSKKIGAVSFLLLFLQEIIVGHALPLGQAVSIEGSEELIRTKKQVPVDSLEWTVSEWSECTVTCGGGLQTRSVRCLDEDGVISQDCDDNNRPTPYQFCGQVNCTTLASVPDALPPTGEYTWISGDGTSTVLSFENQRGGRYKVQQNTTENDQTLTNFEQTVDPPTTRTSTRVSGRRNVISFQQNGGISSLVVNENSILSLEDIQQLRFSAGQSIGYDDGVITTHDGTTLANDVDRLHFYDGFRFYQFDNDKINNISGPGTLYLNPVSGVALYSTSSNFNSRFDGVLALLSSVTPDIEIATTTIPTTSSPSTAPVSTEAITSDVSTDASSTPEPDVTTDIVVTVEPLTATVQPITDKTTDSTLSTDEPTESTPEDSSTDKKSKTPNVNSKTLESSHLRSGSRKGVHSREDRKKTRKPSRVNTDVSRPNPRTRDPNQRGNFSEICDRKLCRLNNLESRSRESVSSVSGKESSRSGRKLLKQRKPVEPSQDRHTHTDRKSSKEMTNTEDSEQMRSDSNDEQSRKSVKLGRPTRVDDRNSARRQHNARSRDANKIDSDDSIRGDSNVPSRKLSGRINSAKREPSHASRQQTGMSAESSNPDEDSARSNSARSDSEPSRTTKESHQGKQPSEINAHHHIHSDPADSAISSSEGSKPFPEDESATESPRQQPKGVSHRHHSRDDPQTSKEKSETEGSGSSDGDDNVVSGTSRPKKNHCKAKKLDSRRKSNSSALHDKSTRDMKDQSARQHLSDKISSDGSRSSVSSSSNRSPTGESSNLSPGSSLSSRSQSSVSSSGNITPRNKTPSNSRLRASPQRSSRNRDPVEESSEVSDREIRSHGKKVSKKRGHSL